MEITYYIDKMYRNNLIFIFLCLLLRVSAQTPVIDRTWKLDWEESFDALDVSRWKTQNYAIHGEEQMYMDSQVDVRNGYLTLKFKKLKRRAKIECDRSQHSGTGSCAQCEKGKGYRYISGWIESDGDYVVRYGYIEAKIKIEHKKWMWPAFWTWQHCRNCNNQAEIDIFEMYGKKKDNHIETNIHHVYNDTIEPSNTYLWTIDMKNEFSYTDWHKYAIEWDSKKIIWYVDDSPIRTTYNHDITDSVRIIFNLAMRGEPFFSFDVPGSATMSVDYVKKYSLRCDGKTSVKDITNFNNYSYEVVKDITLTSATHLPASEHVSLRATDFIELKPGFETPSSGSVYFDVCPCNGK